MHTFLTGHEQKPSCIAYKQTKIESFYRNRNVILPERGEQVRMANQSSQDGSSGVFLRDRSSVGETATGSVSTFKLDGRQSNKRRTDNAVHTGDM